MTIIKNVTPIDRAIRVAVGLLLIVLALFDKIGPWGWLGVIPLATGLMSWCPAYSLLGIGKKE